MSQGRLEAVSISFMQLRMQELPFSDVGMFLAPYVNMIADCSRNSWCFCDIREDAQEAPDIYITAQEEQNPTTTNTTNPKASIVQYHRFCTKNSKSFDKYLASVRSRTESLMRYKVWRSLKTPWRLTLMMRMMLRRSILWRISLSCPEPRPDKTNE